MGACYAAVLWKVGMISLRGLGLLEKWKASPPYQGFNVDFVLGMKNLQAMINDDVKLSSSAPSPNFTKDLSGFTTKAIEDIISFMSSDPDEIFTKTSIQKSGAGHGSMSGFFEDLPSGFLF